MAELGYPIGTCAVHKACGRLAMSLSLEPDVKKRLPNFRGSGLGRLAGWGSGGSEREKRRGCEKPGWARHETGVGEHQVMAILESQDADDISHSSAG